MKIHSYSCTLAFAFLNSEDVMNMKESAFITRVKKVCSHDLSFYSNDYGLRSVRFTCNFVFNFSLSFFRDDDLTKDEMDTKQVLFGEDYFYLLCSFVCRVEHFHSVVMFDSYIISY